MQNTQVIKKPEASLDGLLAVHSIWKTIQGEGPFAGMPAVFVRLEGCNLQCSLCDTDYSSRSEVMPTHELLAEVQRVSPSTKWKPLVVLTGGEPFRQNVVPLIKLLHREGYKIQVETNGTLFREEFSARDFSAGMMTIVCSPKAKVHPALKPLIQAYKYVIEWGYVSQDDGLPTRVLGQFNHVDRPPLGFPKEFVYVQPCDSGDVLKNKDNLKAALDSCQRFGYRICLQQHKILGLP